MPTFGGTGVGGYGGSLGWSVGNLDWLNDPGSKVNRYWRVIEQGSNATDWPWQGRRIVGLWGPNAGPRTRLINGGDLSAFQRGRGDQKFVPFFRSIDQADNRRAARAALYYFFGGGKGKNMELLNVDPSSTANAKNRRYDVESNRKRIYFWLMTRARVEDMPFVQGVIIREVQAGHYYARALLSFGDPVERELDELRRVMAHVYGAGGGWADPTTPAGLKKGRQYQALDAYSKYGDVAPKTGRRRTEKRTHSAAVGGRYIATVNATAYVQDFIRTGRGTISQYVSEMTKVNQRMAVAFQAEVVQLMMQDRRRPMSGDLIKAHRDARNRTP
jgi:hypothetical protein